MAGVTKHDRLKNVKIREILKQQSIRAKIENRQINWYSHLMRRGQKRLVRKAVEGREYKKKKEVDLEKPA